MRQLSRRFIPSALLLVIGGCAPHLAEGWRLIRNEQGVCAITSLTQVKRNPIIEANVGMTIAEDFSYLEVIYFRADFRLVVGAIYEVELSIDEMWSEREVVQIIEPTMVEFTTPLTPELFDALIHGSALRIHGAQDTIVVALGEAARAIPVLVECMEPPIPGEDSREGNPFGEPISPENRM